MSLVIVMSMLSVSIAVFVGDALVDGSREDRTDENFIRTSGPPSAKPDLEITFIEITDAYGTSSSSDNGLIIGAGQEFAIAIEITNLGRATASPFSTDLYIDQSDGTSKYCGRQDSSVPLPAEGVSSLTWSGLFTSIAGASVVRAVTDSTNTNLETDEGNNVKTLTNPVNNAARTVAIYMCADNDLESYAIEDFVYDMASQGAGSSKDLSVIVMMDRSSEGDTSYGNWNDAKYFFVKEGTTCSAEDALVDVGEVDMGNSTTLHNFLTWGFDRFRASLYDLVLMDHGMAAQGVCYDYGSEGDYITLNELADVLQDVTGHMGTIFDLIGFDACLQSWAENLYACTQYTNTVLGSVDAQFSGGWSYGEAFRQLRANPSMTTADLCSMIVEDYLVNWTPISGFVTMAAFRSSGIDSVIEGIDGLSEALISVLGNPASKSQIQQALGATERCPRFDPIWDPFGVDIYDMAVQLKASCADQDIDNAAQNVIDAILDSNTVVDYGAGAFYNLDRIRCLGVVWPETLSLLDLWSINLEEYRTSYFSQNTMWDDFIVAYFDTPPEAFIDQAPSGPVNQGVTVSFSGHGTDSDGTIMGYSWRSSIDGQLSTSASFSTATLSAGLHTIYFKVQDDAGVWSPEVQMPFPLEVVAVPNDPPTTPGQPTISPGDEVDGTFTLTWTPSVDNDATPVAGYYLMESFNNGAWRDVNTNIPTNSITLTAEPGSHVYIVCAFDSANPPLWSPSWSTPDFLHPIIVPDQPPTTPGVPHLLTPGDETDGTFTLTWTPSEDADSTPLAYYCLIESVNTGGGWSAWQNISETLTTNSIVLTRPPGSYVYAVCAGDTADLWSGWAQMLIPPAPGANPIVVPVPDSVPPVTTATLSGTQGDNGWYLSSVTVTLSAADSNGVQATYYKIDNARRYTTYTGPFQVATDGGHTVYFYSIDNMGYTETVQSASVWVDEAAPTTSATANIGKLTITLTAADGSGSGIAATYYKLDSGTWQVYTGPIKVTGGTHTVYYYSADNAGNQEDQKSSSWNF